eukprot:UC1_evm2s1693
MRPLLATATAAVAGKEGGQEATTPTMSMNAQSLLDKIVETVRAAHERARGNANPFHATITVAAQGLPDDLNKLQLDRKDLLAGSVLGMGQFGAVHRATRAEAGGKKSQVAVKVLRATSAVRDMADALREVETLAALNHANVVPLVGIVVQDRPWLIVLGLSQYGDVRRALIAVKGKGRALREVERLQICTQVAAAMVYLADRRYIHMDLAARNVLLGKSNVVKVCDFGLTRRIPSRKRGYRMAANVKLPIKWMSPESMHEGAFTDRSDIWSMAVVMWEVYAYGATPYGERRGQDLQDAVRDGLRLTFPPGTHEAVLALATKCWARDWQERPAFDEVHDALCAAGRNARERDAPRDIGALLTAKPDQDPLLTPDISAQIFSPAPRAPVPTAEVTPTRRRGSVSMSRSSSTSEAPIMEEEPLAAATAPTSPSSLTLPATPEAPAGAALLTATPAVSAPPAQPALAVVETETAATAEPESQQVDVEEDLV